MIVKMIIIDPQNSFCHPLGELFVPGADQDSVRLGNFIERKLDVIDKIHVTLDSHNEVDIAHPIFWLDEKNKNPAPFTIISKKDFASGKWRPSNPSCNKIVENYLDKLEKNNRYPLCIWPPHCIIGKTEKIQDQDGSYVDFCGHAVVEPVSKALTSWAKKRFKRPDYVTKGSNPFTEHYSAVQADVPDPSDPSTSLNTNLIYSLETSDIIYITGQALSHCVKFTIMDIAQNFDPSCCKKLTLLEDTSSSVPGFEKNGEDFKEWLLSVGGKVVKTTDL